ncbi:hypothetical protein DPMN_150770 [Dreissena polymorpha]|uniref:Uncharacterized protein n=1 Tax=Dreissena polymorpha TaxID=45954 RepID=A0A9D4J5W8_DREPO|nr:hypothetical protein DPMN_163203 [Dreissena polymorpha]KAH3797194.1 hypothetical protein DPMN_150770 [Dreissena polymorpha]
MRTSPRVLFIENGKSDQGDSSMRTPTVIFRSAFPLHSITTTDESEPHMRPPNHPKIKARTCSVVQSILVNKLVIGTSLCYTRSPL